MSGPRVQSFPPNRVCAECATVLSIYNETEFCCCTGGPVSGWSTALSK